MYPQIAANIYNVNSIATDLQYIFFILLAFGRMNSD